MKTKTLTPEVLRGAGGLKQRALPLVATPFVYIQNPNVH